MPAKAPARQNDPIGDARPPCCEGKDETYKCPCSCHGRPVSGKAALLASPAPPADLVRYNSDCLPAGPDGAPSDDPDATYRQRWVYLAEAVEAQVAAQAETLKGSRACLDNLIADIEKAFPAFKAIVDEACGDISVNTAFKIALDNERREQAETIQQLTRAVQGNALEVVKANQVAAETIQQLTQERDLAKRHWKLAEDNQIAWMQKWEQARAEVTALRTDAAEIRSSYGFLLMRCAVASDLDDVYAVCRREFEDHEHAHLRLGIAVGQEPDWEAVREALQRAPAPQGETK